MNRETIDSLRKAYWEIANIKLSPLSKKSQKRIVEIHYLLDVLYDDAINELAETL